MTYRVVLRTEVAAVYKADNCTCAYYARIIDGLIYTPRRGFGALTKLEEVLTFLSPSIRVAPCMEHPVAHKSQLNTVLRATITLQVSIIHCQSRFAVATKDCT